GLADQIDSSLVAFVLQLHCYSFKPGAEDECLNLRNTVLDSVREFDKQPAVQVHRSRDITEDYESGLFPLATLERKFRQLSPGLQTRTQRPSQVDSSAAGFRLPTSTWPRREPPNDSPRDSSDLLKLIGGETAEIVCGVTFNVARSGHRNRLGLGCRRRPVLKKKGQPF